MSQRLSKSNPQSPSRQERLTVKVLVLGSPNVGKSSLIDRYVLQRFQCNRVPTLGTDIISKELIIDETQISLQIWDKAGQERFPSNLTSNFYRRSDGALLVYDVCNEKSIEQIYQWQDEVKSKVDCPFVVVGNKIDMRNEHNTVDQSTIKEFCSRNGYEHVEISAKDNLDVEAAMISLVTLALEKHRAELKNQTINEESKNIKISEMYNTSRKQSNSGGCGK